MLSVIRFADRFREIDQPWQPRVVGSVNDFHVKLARLEGSFLWHHHEVEDELFLVVSGTLEMHHRDADGSEHLAVVHPGEMIIVPHGMEHLPVAREPVEVLLFEPATTLNTGTTVNERTYID